MTQLGSDWRWLAGTATAWYAAPSLTAAAALASQVVELAPDAGVDVRATGLRVRLTSAEDGDLVSGAARDAGLEADPSALQQLGVVVGSTSPEAVAAFWEPLLDDPLRREVPVEVLPSSESRPLRNRVHLDVVRPGAVVERLALGAGSGPYGVRHADPDGNEVDLVPGEPLDAAPDWQGVFSAVACYRVTSTAQQRSLVSAAAALAEDAGFPLLVDLRPGLVVLDSGKDQADADAHGLDLDFGALAARVQRAAHDAGAAADPSLPCFVQVFLDAADVPAVRAFWLAALGYVPDQRAGLADIHDPRRLGPVLVFQELDASETERRRQRNRTHLELAVPADAAAARLADCRAAGGRVLEESPGRWLVADPEGNELALVTRVQP